MAKYIEKAAIIAEIGRLIDSNKSLKTLDPTYCEGLDDSLGDVLSFLDTLEVKEVDLEKEVTNWWNNHYTSAKKGYTFEGYSGHYMENSTIVSLAQYFFELGLKTQKGE